MKVGSGAFGQAGDGDQKGTGRWIAMMRYLTPSLVSPTPGIRVQQLNVAMDPQHAVMLHVWIQSQLT